VRRVLAVTGTRREASVLRHAGVVAVAIGGSGAALDAALAAQGGAIDGIISFGMGGALGPDLKLGDWVIGTGLCGAVSALCDAEWAAALARQLPGARSGPCYADGRLIGDSNEKQALYRKYGALVADMESHLVGQAAARLGIPFAILRCISDEAAADLPPAIAVAMRPDGRLALGAIFKSILTNPLQLPALMGSTTRFNRAFAALEAGAKRVFSQS
jgi:hopanoid-associated phosphorylase